MLPFWWSNKLSLIIRSEMLMRRATQELKWLNIPSGLGYDGGAVLVQGAVGKPASDAYKVYLI